MFEDGLVFRIGSGGQKQLMVPKNLEDNIMRLMHEKNGHFGVEKCTNQIQKYYWFPNIKEKLEKFIKNCLKCIYYSASPRKSDRHLYNIEKKPIPFDTIHVDYFGPLPSVNSRHKYVFGIIDGFTKFVKLYATNSNGAREACGALQRYFEYYSRPNRIISDRGTCFTANEFSEFVSKNNIEHVKISVQSPQSNGQIERMNRDLKNMLSKLAESATHADWRTKLMQVEYAFNNTNHTSTQVSPSILLFGVEQRGRIIDELTEYLQQKEKVHKPVDLKKIRSEASNAISKSQERNLKYFNEHHRPAKQFEVGEYVVIKNVDVSVGKNKKLIPKYRGPYEIKKKFDHDRYLVEDIADFPITQMPYHGILDSTRLKKWINSDTINGNELDNQGNTK